MKSGCYMAKMQKVSPFRINKLQIFIVPYSIYRIDENVKPGKYENSLKYCPYGAVSAPRGGLAKSKRGYFALKMHFFVSRRTAVKRDGGEKKIFGCMKSHPYPSKWSTPRTTIKLNLHFYACRICALRGSPTDSKGFTPRTFFAFNFMDLRNHEFYLLTPPPPLAPFRRSYEECSR